MIVYYVLVVGVVLLFGASVIWAFYWALRGGQFSDFARGAASIFDEEEPQGCVTDAFPDRREAVERLNRARRVDATRRGVRL